MLAKILARGRVIALAAFSGAAVLSFLTIFFSSSLGPWSQSILLAEELWLALLLMIGIYLILGIREKNRRLALLLTSLLATVGLALAVMLNLHGSSELLLPAFLVTVVACLTITALRLLQHAELEAKRSLSSVVLGLSIFFLPAYLTTDGSTEEISLRAPAEESESPRAALKPEISESEKAPKDAAAAKR